MMEKKHYDYLDACRGLAILAVVVDHTKELAYSSDRIWHLSFFSVSLFILLSGITAFLSMHAKQVEGYQVSYVWRRLKAIFVPYFVATAFCIFVNGGYHFNFVEFVKAVILFSGAPPYYFVFFFLQLILVSPFLYTAVRILFIKKKHHWLVNALIVVCVVLTAYLCTEYTTMLELHGGGVYLLGGSYLIIYFLGMILAVFLLRGCSLATEHAVGILSVIGFIFYAVWFLEYVSSHNYTFFYYKWAANPPSIFLLLYALCVYGCVYYAYARMRKGEGKGTSLLDLLRPLEICGKYSLDIFLFHSYCMIILRNTLFISCPLLFENIWLRRICILAAAVALPILVRFLYEKLKVLLVKNTKDILRAEENEKV